MDSSSQTDWSANDSGVDYGSPGNLSFTTSWDGNSQDLYDSDPI